MYLSISSQLTLLQPNIAKKLQKPLFLGFKVISVDIPKKIIASACYHKQHLCAYLQPFSRWTNQQRINYHFLRGTPI